MGRPKWSPRCAERLGAAIPSSFELAARAFGQAMIDNEVLHDRKNRGSQPSRQPCSDEELAASGKAATARNYHGSAAAAPARCGDLID